MNHHLKARTLSIYPHHDTPCHFCANCFPYPAARGTFKCMKVLPWTLVFVGAGYLWHQERTIETLRAELSRQHVWRNR